MLNQKPLTRSFPSAHIPGQPGGLPIEVTLIAQLAPGAGDALYAAAVARQSAHATFIDALDEPSAKLGGTDFAKGDATALYSFSVGPDGHPFHRHAGHRVFTAIAGSGGAQLRFSTATAAQIDEDPQNFFACLHYVDIPADSLFTVRFGGETWHQFVPLVKGRLHPTFFALSCHTNELGGNLADGLRAQVLAGKANIPALTELLPTSVEALLALEEHAIPVSVLVLDADELQPSCSA